MKQLYLFITLSFLFISCCNISAQTTQNFSKGGYYFIRVTDIVDGDTFRGLTADNKEFKFRLFGIDAPEKKQNYSDKSKQYLSELIQGKTVRIKIQKVKDTYNRPVIWVYTSDGKEVNSEMLKAGMAWHFKRYDSSATYSNIEKQARRQKNGLWKDANPVAPWDFRKSHTVPRSLTRGKAF